MDKSFIELLKAVASQIDHGELNEAIKADNFEGEFALSEDGLASAQAKVSKLLTLEAAINNPEVIEKINKDSYPKHMKTALSKVEDKLRPVYDKLGIDYSGAEYLSDKISDIEEKISEAISSGDNKGVIEALNKELREARELPDRVREEYELKIQEQENSFKAEKIKDKFLLTANNNTWADAYSDPDLKGALLDKKWDKLNANAHLKLEDGEIRVMQKDMPDKELYNGNTVVTFQSLLEPEIEPYLKKSSPEKVNKSEQKAEKPQADLTPNQQRMLEQRKRFKMVS